MFNDFNEIVSWYVLWDKVSIEFLNTGCLLASIGSSFIYDYYYWYWFWWQSLVMPFHGMRSMKLSQSDSLSLSLSLSLSILPSLPLVFGWEQLLRTKWTGAQPNSLFILMFLCASSTLLLIFAFQREDYIYGSESQSLRLTQIFDWREGRDRKNDGISESLWLNVWVFACLSMKGSIHSFIIERMERIKREWIPNE